MGIKIGEPSPQLWKTAQWLNNSPSIDENPQTPFVVHFWALSCPSCKHNMPALQSLRDGYASIGLRAIAVHMPRNADDLDITQVLQKAKDLGITEPCAIDNDHAIGNAFQTGGLWPVYFLFDGEGKLRCRAAGGFGVKMMERTLARIFPDAPTLDKSACSCGKTSGGGCCQDS